LIPNGGLYNRQVFPHGDNHKKHYKI